MQILAIITTFIAAATVFLLVRLYTRFWFVKAPGVDDCLMVAALMADYVFYAFSVVETKHGLGHAQKVISSANYEAQLKALYLIVPFYNLSLTLTKLSMLVLYMRIFPTPGILLATRVLTGVLAVAGLWMVISSFAFCAPVSAFWDTGIGARCLPEAVWFVNASLQIASDVVIVCFPMPVLGRLRLPVREKVGVMLVFGVGVFVCAVSAVRLWALEGMVSSWDTTRTNGPVTVWSSVEANVAIICATLPALHPLLSRVFPRRLIPGSWSRPRSRAKEGSGSGSGSGSRMPGGSVDGGEEGRRGDGQADGEGKVDDSSGRADGELNGLEDAVVQAEEEEDWSERLERKRWRRELEAGQV